MSVDRLTLYGMVAQILELSPSGAGWYYAHRPLAEAPIRRAYTPVLPRPVDINPPDLADIGYGPDGRVRLASSPPRIWFLA